MSDVGQSDERLSEALAHVRDAVAKRGRHSLTSCPLHSRAMCDYYDVLAGLSETTAASRGRTDA